MATSQRASPQPSPAWAQQPGGASQLAIHAQLSAQDEPAGANPEEDPHEAIRVLVADDHAIVRAGICSLLRLMGGIQVVAQAADGCEVLRLLEEASPHPDAPEAGTRQRNHIGHGAGHGAVPTIDIALLDISMKEMNGLEATSHITRLYPRTRVLMLSMHDSEEYVLQAMKAGASGYLLKESSAGELEMALRAVARGKTYLSPAVSRHLVAAYVHRAPTLPTGGARLASASQEAVVLTPRQREILPLLAQGLSNGQVATRLSISIKTVESHRSQLMKRLGVYDLLGLVRYAIRHGFIEPL